MTREEFVEYLRSGEPVTPAIARITGTIPTIVTIADLEDNVRYIRYGLMMAGEKLVALVILSLDIHKVPADLLARIRSGEPTGLVLDGMTRMNVITVDYPRAIQCGGFLIRKGRTIGRADEIFTESLFR